MLQYNPDKIAKSDLFIEKNLIGGEWVSAQDGAVIEVDNPSTGVVIGSVPNCGATETAKAIEAAEQAFPEWSRRTASERSALLERWHDLMLTSR